MTAAVTSHIAIDDYVAWPSVSLSDTRTTVITYSPEGATVHFDAAIATLL